MKVLREYVWDSIRRNRRTSIAIMAALFLMTTMMSCFCGFIYTMWTDMVRTTKIEQGDWHGELFSTTYAKDLETIENYASVETVLLKGPWQTLQFSENEDRNFILFRGANEDYWRSMPEKDSIIEGRRPQKENEIALSKQFFDDNPQIQVGDSLTLLSGQRTLNGTVCEPTAPRREGETFEPQGEITLRLVGKLDVTTSSVVPAYSGLSWFDESNLAPEDELTVYLRFTNMRDTYKELPALAESIGYEKDEYGKYMLRYNTDLLTKYAIFSQEQLQAADHLTSYAVPLMFLVIAALLVAVFVLVIHNAFALSAEEKLSQLGTLAGVGAAPGQIKSVVISEAFILSIIPVPLGVLAGWLLDMELINLLNSANDYGRSMPDIVLTFGLPSALPAVILALLTAWLSARIPAKKVAKMMPVEALRSGNNPAFRPKRRHFLASHFGISGELAATALSARRKSYRTSTISLCLSFLLLTGFLYITTSQEAAAGVYGNPFESIRHISVRLEDGNIPDDDFLETMRTVPGITGSVYFNTMACALWTDESAASKDFRQHLGGFKNVTDMKKYSMIERDEKYRIYTNLIGLDAKSFTEYCNAQGIDPAPYFQDPKKAIIYNQTADPDKSTRKETVNREFLDLKKGQTLTMTEKAYDEDDGDYEFDLVCQDFVSELPPINKIPSTFTLNAVMPMENVFSIASSCSEKRQLSSHYVTGLFVTADGKKPSFKELDRISGKMEKLLSHTYKSGDYVLSDLSMESKADEDVNRTMNIIVVFLTGLLAMIGLSNVWAGITGNLRLRRREFAMLKSVGLSPAQLWKMLFIESFFLGIRPLVFSVPGQIAILAVFLSINEITLAEYLPYAPVGTLVLYTLLVLLCIAAAYLICGHKLQKEEIAAAVRDDTL